MAVVNAYLVQGIQVLVASHLVWVGQPLVQVGLVDLQGGRGVHQGDLHQEQAGALAAQENNLKHGDVNYHMSGFITYVFWIGHIKDILLGLDITLCKSLHLCHLWVCSKTR